MHITSENLECCIVTLFIHNVCNYSCSYCSDYHRDGSFRWPNDWTKYLEFINELKKRNKYLYIEVLGGEPTVWPKFQDFIDAISDDNVFIEYATNASRTLNYWKKFREQNTFVFLSWHNEECNDDHFIEVAKIMQHKASVSIPLMVAPGTFLRAKKIFNRLSELNVEVTPKFVRKTIHGTKYFDYNVVQRNWITNAYHNKMKPFGIDWKFPHTIRVDGKEMKFMKILDKGLHKFKGYTCTAGLKRFMVEPDGNILRCTKRVGGSLGNINTEYTLPDDPIVCTYEACPCKLDAVVEKWI